MRPALRALLFALPLLSAPATAQTPHWADGYDGGVFSRGHALVVHDPGTGPELFAFGVEPVTQGPLVARFDGATWRPGTSAVQYVVDAVSADLGAGQEIFGTTGSTQVLRSAGASWGVLGAMVVPPTPPFTNNAATTGPIVAWNDGGGPAVFVGGYFLFAGGVSANNIARCNGSTWTALGSGTDTPVAALAVHDDGGGTALYAGGAFTTAGGVPVNGIARWRNGAWSDVPGLGAGSSIAALCVFDDGAGPRLHAGGALVVGGSSTNLAVWDGAAWTPVGAPSGATMMIVHDDGGGSALFAGAAGLSRRRGGAWTTLPLPAASAIGDLQSYGGLLWISGLFGWAGPGGISNVQSWDGVQFRSAFTGLGTNGEILAARVLDVGNGPRLFAGGSFPRAGRTPARNIASLDGTSWSNLGPGLDSFVRALAAYDDGTGPKLYAGGAFASPAMRIGRWDGTSWSAPGGGITGPFDGGRVNALEAFDDGAGMQLYAGGLFGNAGGTAVSNIARWNGTTWSAVGAGFGSPGFQAGEVLAFASYDEGSGPRLFAAGRLQSSGTTALNRVARWDGTSWTPVGAGPAGASDVFALCVHDDGSGPSLYAGGNLDGKVQRWNGTAWSPVGTGLLRPVVSLCVHDDATGPKLYAGFVNTSSLPAVPGIQRWDGIAWTPVAGTPGSRLNEQVAALVDFDDPSNDPAALHALGRFAGGESLSSNVAKRSVASEDVPVCLGDGSGTACPCGNASPSTEAAGCLHSFGLAGRLRTSGSVSTTNDTFALLGTSMPGSSSALYFQGTSSLGMGAGAAFGDGLRCAGGVVLRLGSVTNAGGASQIPDAQHPAPISSSGAIPAGGGTRVYQAWYRNAASFCTPSTFNLTNGVRIVWRP